MDLSLKEWLAQGNQLKDLNLSNLYLSGYLTPFKEIIDLDHKNQWGHSLFQITNLHDVVISGKNYMVTHIEADNFLFVQKNQK